MANVRNVRSSLFKALATVAGVILIQTTNLASARTTALGTPETQDTTKKIAQNIAQDIPQTWLGTWIGELKNFPSRLNAPRVEVRREISQLKVSADQTIACATFRTRYAENGQERAVKEYQLCRDDKQQWFIDEGNDIRLQARWLDGMLVSVFKYGNIVLQSSIRIDVNDHNKEPALRMVEEIISSRDEQKNTEIQSLPVMNLQKLILFKQN